MSSSDDTTSDEDDYLDDSIKTGQFVSRSNRIDKILKPVESLRRSAGENDDLSQKELSEMREFLQDGLRHRSQTCLICIETLKSNEAIWSCSSCFTVFHLTCIQSWAQHGLSESVLRTNDNESEENVLAKARWHCPKCRNEYGRGQCPKEYRCFCQKVMNPKLDPWLLAHSCGQTCGRRLADCEHTCMLLCHPGPCPMCPKTVMVSCYCGKTRPTMRRCGQKYYSCNKECGKKLTCNHVCRSICHSGPCQPCDANSQRPCVCGRRIEKRPCSDGRWRCAEVCGRQLNCKRHLCQRVCHDGDCQPCGNGEANKCPCGKTRYDVTNSVLCIDDMRPCGDTCGKLLDCGVHYCVERCHKGECPSCTQLREKRCRCGLKEKLVPCGKEFLCEIKCKQKRQCNRHPCNRRCCDGQCPPCEQVCGRTLQCGKHKCQTPCHRGLCYPCILMVEVTCRCGRTKIKVPCGREKRTKPPRCRQQCEIKPDCHHPRRESHTCHFGDCPPCRQICSKSLKTCNHSCASSCHSAVWMDVNAEAAKRPTTSPLDKHQPKFERVDLPCPPCRYPVPVKCVGGHEVSDLPCSEAKPYSCGRKCGQPLACGNHQCGKICHSIKDDPCQDCTESCTLPRPADCTHPCLRACHPAPCGSCRQMLRRTCHCGVNQKYISCAQWNTSDQNTRRDMLSCGNPCPKQLVCGHQCTLLCHDGACSLPDDCERKVTIRCPCGRRSTKAICSKIRRGISNPLVCDNDCAVLKEELLKQKHQSQENAGVPFGNDETKDLVNMGPRRRRKQKTRPDETGNGASLAKLLRNRVSLITASISVVFIAVVVYWLLM